MPLYEEKLISAFAVHFMQAEIRDVFRDGQNVEATAALIDSRPGEGAYDIILQAPFPAIEIIRRDGTRGSGFSDSSESCSEEAEAERWFTFDNRRLYCLQRAAAAHWPQRVGVQVQVLYADHAPQMWRKKYDTESGGRTVRVIRSHKDAPGAGRLWDWRRAVRVRASRGPEPTAALATIAADGRKVAIGDLQDVPGAGDQVARLLAFIASAPQPQAREVELEAAECEESVRSPKPKVQCQWQGWEAGAWRHGGRNGRRNRRNWNGSWDWQRQHHQQYQQQPQQQPQPPQCRRHA